MEHRNITYPRHVEPEGKSRKGFQRSLGHYAQIFISSLSFSLTQEATGVGEEGEKKEEEMEGRQAGDGASGSADDNIQQEGGQGSNNQQQPQQEAAIPEGARNQQAGNNLAHHRYNHTRFTHAQLHDLERLFQETHYPTFRARRHLARCMGVEEYDVLNWFRMRRSLYKRNKRLLMLCYLSPLPQSDSP
ncbi:paired mesoderm homeobox protein 2-like [Grammomys surdaster]|uniref:paired mesoderm homeobox protein 2-like n=1 Tax=Grammomys surdaster TaxID=491861 RepID=UPI00109F6AC0|nr:paired mesoderm homeobox protein 2-like [Grammomys surdaster]